MFTVIPAIDLKDGGCVRLTQGRADETTIYADDPIAVARMWEVLGATYIHVVDLDGAFQGRPVHTQLIAAIASAVSVPIEVGGGLRTQDDLTRTIGAGASRVIVGTKAITNPEMLQTWASQFGDKLVLGIDAKDGFVQTSGWVETSTIKALDLGITASRAGVKTIIFTDTSKDGMLAGHNVAATAAMCRAVTCDVIASGGVSSPDDIRALTELNLANLTGAIVGKALYEGLTTLHDLRHAIQMHE